MAIYHFAVSTVSRARGQSAVASAAYRNRSILLDDRTGKTWDYRSRSDLAHSLLMVPALAQGLFGSREEAWNAAEAAEKRVNSTTAREYNAALPIELSRQIQIALAERFARHLVEKYGVIADLSIHAAKGNPHVHILTSTRAVDAAGFGAKTRALDCRTSGEVEDLRAEWAAMVNAALEASGSAERVSHESLAAQGIDRAPQVHLGPAAAAMERRGVSTSLGNVNRDIARAEEAARVEALATSKAEVNAIITQNKAMLNAHPAPEPEPEAEVEDPRAAEAAREALQEEAAARAENLARRWKAGAARAQLRLGHGRKGKAFEEQEP